MVHIKPYKNHNPYQCPVPAGYAQGLKHARKNKRTAMANYYYYVKVKLKSRHDNGTHIYRNLKISARDESGALRQAINLVAASSEGPAISLSVDWLNPIPVKKLPKKKRKKKQRPNWKYDGLTRIR